MSTYDLSYEASISDDHDQSFKGGVRRKLPKAEDIKTPWVEMIIDLVLGANYSYSRIAYGIGASPSAIQKLATDSNRHPRFDLFTRLSKLHEKVFQGQYATPKARDYWNKKNS